ncbi:MAG TPA: NAD(P)/FAD-dependent oxidoreductase [Chthoniobacterales bacterium]
MNQYHAPIRPFPPSGSNALDALVIGAGPNGLAAAITLARAGCSVHLIEANAVVGGGIRSGEATLPGYVHDHCATSFPLAAASPFFRSLALEEFGLEWIHPEIAVAHPSEGGHAACLYHSVEQTAETLGRDGAAYSRFIEPFVRQWDRLVPEVLGPVFHVPRHPLALARFGLVSIRSARGLARGKFRDDAARALIGGIGAHSFMSLDSPASAAFSVMLAAAGHAGGWPFARGGARHIADALVASLIRLGGTIQTDTKVVSLEQLPKTRITIFDVTAWQFLRIAGDRLPQGYGRHLERFRRGPGVFKLDYALSHPVPWTATECRRAGIVHLGGTLEELAISEREVASGCVPERPFVLVAQASLFDSLRAPAGRHTLWAYCHVPNGSTHDMTMRIEAQIERFAPGFRDCVLERTKSSPADFQNGNANLVGGDVCGGAMDIAQLISRPVPGTNPYRTPLPGVYLCSASTAPGGGVHGMCGWHAARAALRDVFGRKAQ